ncbi:MAG: IS3 family transposase, partial [Acidimicrobiales bacterium]
KRAGTMSAEAAVLRREVKRLKDEVEIAKRLAAFDLHAQERERIYQFMKIEVQNFAVAVLASVCKVSRSAWYTWASRNEGPGEQTLEEAYLSNRTFDIWAKSHKRYGAPRVTAQLWRENMQVNGKRVARIMAELGIAGISGRRKLKTTRPSKSEDRGLVGIEQRGDTVRGVLMAVLSEVEQLGGGAK